MRNVDLRATTLPNSAAFAAKSCLDKTLPPRARRKILLTAIATAQRQKTRSLELRAALALAKLYRAKARPSEAYDLLGPALKGSSPTPQFPEIAEAWVS